MVVYKLCRRYPLYDIDTWWSSGFTSHGISVVFGGGHPKEGWLIQYELGVVSKPNKPSEPLFAWSLQQQAYHAMPVNWSSTLDVFECEAQEATQLSDWYKDASWSTGVVFCDWIKPVRLLTDKRLIRLEDGWQHAENETVWHDDTHKGSAGALNAALKDLR